LFLALLERGVDAILKEARLPTLERWLELGDDKNIDAPIVDLAQAELAFSQGKRQKAETLALRAARQLSNSHQLLPRAFYIAGSSAHLDFRNHQAREHFDQALATATTVADRREAAWGHLNVSLDLDDSDINHLLRDLVGLDDGSALSEVRLAIARFQVAIRMGALHSVTDFFDSAEHVVARITDPHVRSSFYLTRAHHLALLGHYDAALSASKRCERYAMDARLSFVILHAKRIRAMTELGIRHFARSNQLLDWLDREAGRAADIFLQVESRLIRCRVLVAQRLAARGAEVLATPPKRFPFEAERAEFLATRSMALACCGQQSSALRLADKAQNIARTVEVRTLVACVRAIVALQNDSPEATDIAAEAFRTVIESGSVDSFVASYRGCPALLSATARTEKFAEPLTEIIERAHDWTVARESGVPGASKRPRSSLLTPRELDVIELIAQGLTNREIAKTLFVSEATAKVHVRHILEKLGVRSRTEAALRAVDAVSEGT
jgi:DNA-binding NarL/FixJ family response regulator